MKLDKRRQLGALLAVILLLNMTFIPAVSDVPSEDPNKNKIAEQNLAFEFKNITKVKVKEVTVISDLVTNGIQNTNELNIPPSINKYDLVTFDQVELNNKISELLPVFIRGERYNIKLERMNFENLDDEINSYKGKIVGVNNSEVILTTSDRIINGRVTINDETFWIRPIEPRKRVEKDKSPLHIIYSSKDLESSKIPALIDNGSTKAPYSLQNKYVGQQYRTIQNYTEIGFLVGTDNQFYQDETEWKVTAQGIIADANDQFQRNDISLVLWVLAYDDSKRYQLSNNSSIESDPLETFTYYFNNQYLDGMDVDIAIYLGGYDADSNANGIAYKYPNGRHGWAQMVRDWYLGGWTYDGSDHGRRVVTIHEIGHMFDADHEDSGGFNQAYDWWSGLTHKYTVMWSTYKGNNGLFEFSSIGYNGDSTHDNARSIREAKYNVSSYV